MAGPEQMLLPRVDCATTLARTAQPLPRPQPRDRKLISHKFEHSTASKYSSNLMDSIAPEIPVASDGLASDLIPPRRYRLMRHGRWSAAIYIETEDVPSIVPSLNRSTSALISDESPSFSPFKPFRRKSTTDGFQPLNASSPVYFLEFSERKYTLWRGAGPDLRPANPGREVLHSTTEGKFRRERFGRKIMTNLA